MEVKKTDWVRSASATATNKKADTPLFPFLTRLIRGEDLSTAESAAFFNALTDSEANQAQIAGALTALTIKGETQEELAGMASIMRKHSIKVKSSKKNVVDITGTGSSTAKTFNISTAAALVAAGAGLSIAKKSNIAGMSTSGNTDIIAQIVYHIAKELAVT